MSLPAFPLFIDIFDPAKNGLYPSFGSQVKTTTLAQVRNKSLPLAIVAMQDNSSGSAPWAAIDISAATIRVTIDNPDLFPTQGSFYLNDGTGPTTALLSDIGSSNLQVALNSLSGIAGAGGLTVKQIGQDFICTWNNNGARSLLTSSVGSLYPASEITITELQAGTSDQPEIQSIQINQLPATLQNSFTITAGTPATMNGTLGLATPGMLARFDSLPEGTQSFDAVLQVDVQFPSEDPQTILQIPVTVHRDVIRDGISALPPFDAAVAYDPETNALTAPLAADFYAANPPPPSGAATWGDIIGTLSNQTDLQSALNAKLSIDSSGYVTAFNTRVSAVTLTTADVNAVGPLTLNVTGNLTGNASTATTATSATTATTAGNLSGTPALPNGTTATTQTVGDSSAKLATMAAVQTSGSSTTAATSLPFLLGPKNHNYINAGDSLTQAPSGIAAQAPFAFSADEQGLGLGQAPSSLFYNMGFSGDTTAQISTRYANSGVTTTITTISGSATATVASASGISNGMCIGSANTAPNTTLTISGTTVTLSRVATATGAVTCSIAAIPIGNFSERYSGGLANGWLNFQGTPHQLSFAVSGLASTYMLWAGANDYLENVASAVTVTATTTSGSPNVTVTGGTFTGIVNGCVITSSNLPSAVPLYVVSGAGTANLVLSGNATGTGSASTVAHFPTTAFLTWQSTYAALVATAKADSNTVYCITLPPAGNTGAGNQGDPVGNSFRLQWNSYIVSNAMAADYVVDVTTVLPAYGSVAGSPYYSADNLHFSPQGHALLGRFFTQQMFSQQLTAALAWTPFAVNALPDSCLSTNIPQKNQSGNIFNPVASCVGTTITLNGTTTGTITGSTAGIFPGMYVAGQQLSSTFYPNTAFPIGTTVASISGTTIVFSNAALVSTLVTCYFSYSPFPFANVFKGDLYIGPSNDVSAGSQSTLHFTSQADLFFSGMVWDSTLGVTKMAIGANLTTLRMGLFGTALISLDTSAQTMTVTAANGSTFSGNVTSAGNLVLSAANKTLSIKAGTTSGTVTLTAGAGTITSAAITTSSVIILTLKTASGANSYPQILANAGSATITGLATDGGIYNWAMILANQ